MVEQYDLKRKELNVELCCKDNNTNAVVFN